MSFSLFSFFFWNLGVEDILFRKEWARYLFCCYWNIHLVSVACSWLGSAYSVIIKINMYLLYKSQQVLKNIEANIVNYFKVYSNMGKSKDFYQRAVWHYKHFLAILSHIYSATLQNLHVPIIKVHFACLRVKFWREIKLVKRLEGTSYEERLSFG